MTTSPERGANQRRHRTQLADRGWCALSTFVRVEHRAKLEELKREHGLRSLHEALDVALSGYLDPTLSDQVLRQASSAGIDAK